MRGQDWHPGALRSERLARGNPQFRWEEQNLAHNPSRCLSALDMWNADRDEKHCSWYIFFTSVDTFQLTRGEPVHSASLYIKIMRPSLLYMASRRFSHTLCASSPLLTDPFRDHVLHKYVL